MLNAQMAYSYYTSSYSIGKLVETRNLGEGKLWLLLLRDENDT